MPSARGMRKIGGQGSSPRHAVRKTNPPFPARVVFVPLSSVRFDERMTPELKKRITEIAVICERVAGYFKGNAQKTLLWFSLPNTLLGNISPVEMIKLGRYKKLFHFV